MNEDKTPVTPATDPPEGFILGYLEGKDPPEATLLDYKTPGDGGAVQS